MFLGKMKMKRQSFDKDNFSRQSAIYPDEFPLLSQPIDLPSSNLVFDILSRKIDVYA